MMLQSLVVIVRGSVKEGKERARQRLSPLSRQRAWSDGEGRMGLIKELVMKKYTCRSTQHLL